MSWNSIIGQQHVQEMLQQCVTGNRIPHALLLSSQPGTGALALAVAFARTVNCFTPQIATSAIAPCGTCPSCIQAQGLQHANIKLVMALPAGKAETEDELPPPLIAEYKDIIATVAADPYTEPRMTGATQIKIGQIRELKRTLALSGAQAGRRVVIIINAEEMTTEASNAFLKTLEEPVANVTLVLITTRRERLLQTIISRCQEMTVPAISDTDLVQALIERAGISKEEALLIAPFSNGSYTQALSFLREDVQEHRKTVVDMLRTALKGKDYRSQLVQAAAEIAEGKDKTKATMMLSLLAVWIRDARLVSELGPDAPITNIDQQQALERFASSFSNADYSAALSVLEGAVQDIYRNVGIQLTCITTMLQLRSIFLSARTVA